MARYISGLSSLGRQGNYVTSNTTGELIGEIVSYRGKLGIKLEECAVNEYGAGLLMAALRKGGFVK